MLQLPLLLLPLLQLLQLLLQLLPLLPLLLRLRRRLLMLCTTAARGTHCHGYSSCQPGQVGSVRGSDRCVCAPINVITQRYIALH